MKCFILLLATLVALSAANNDTFITIDSYIHFVQWGVPIDWVDITQTGFSFDLYDDDCYRPDSTIMESFKTVYYGMDVNGTDITFHSNGMIGFFDSDCQSDYIDSTGCNIFGPDYFPSDDESTPDNAINFFAEDMYGTSGKNSTSHIQVFDVCPYGPLSKHGCLIWEWNNIEYYNDEEEDYAASAEVIMATNGYFAVLYRPNDFQESFVNLRESAGLTYVDDEETVSYGGTVVTGNQCGASVSDTIVWYAAYPCDAEFYGMFCEECPTCGDNGSCLDGNEGAGTCQCINDYTGDLCEIAPVTDDTTADDTETTADETDTTADDTDTTADDTETTADETDTTADDTTADETDTTADDTTADETDTGDESFAPAVTVCVFALAGAFL